VNVIDSGDRDRRAARAPQRLVTQDEQGIEWFGWILSQHCCGVARGDSGQGAVAQAVDDTEQGRAARVGDNPAISRLVFSWQWLPGNCPLDRAGCAGVKHWSGPISS
jgi:hypothetical protein